MVDGSTSSRSGAGCVHGSPIGHGDNWRQLVYTPSCICMFLSIAVLSCDNNLPAKSFYVPCERTMLNCTVPPSALQLMRVTFSWVGGRIPFSLFFYPQAPQILQVAVGCVPLRYGPVAECSRDGRPVSHAFGVEPGPEGYKHRANEALKSQAAHVVDFPTTRRAGETGAGW